MAVKSLVWLGIRTPEYANMVSLYRDVPSLERYTLRTATESRDTLQHFFRLIRKERISETIFLAPHESSGQNCLADTS